MEDVVVEPRRSGAAPTPEGASPAAFPTLAAFLAERKTFDPERASPLTVLVEPNRDVADARRVAPKGSVLVEVSPETTRPSPHASSPEAAQRHVASLDELLEVAREARRDLLLISACDLLTPTALQELRSTLADDSACATVSIAESSAARLPGVPPPGVPRPLPGVVLICREHLLLALEETALVSREDIGLVTIAPGSTLLAKALAAVDRPGFVHRAISSDRPAPIVETPSPLRSPRRLRAARIVVDGRCFAQPLSGTQVQILGLVGGLARAGADLAVMCPATLHPTVATEVDRLGDAVALVEPTRVGRPDVFHRPFQVGSRHELIGCLSVGSRLVVTHQDMILDRTRTYASSDSAWQDYRHTTALAMSSADEVGFFSRHAALDAASEGALELDRATVVTLGVDHLGDRIADDARPSPLGERPFLLVMGNSYWHKNRLFALRLLVWLVETHGWDGGLVFAGGHPGRGSSRDAERAFLEVNPTLRTRFADLGYVSESTQTALYRDAQLVLFPSLYEGFGLIPFEAAIAGTACAYSHRSSMQELLPAAGALPSFDVEEAGPFVFGLLNDEAARARVVAAITDAAAGLTWNRTATGYLEVYARALEREPRGVNRLLLSVPPKNARMTVRESLVLDVYRRRRGFRLAVDGVIRTGSIALRARRRLRRGAEPGL